MACADSSGPFGLKRQQGLETAAFERAPELGSDFAVGHVDATKIGIGGLTELLRAAEHDGRA
jgi:hypothetical protein